MEEKKLERTSSTILTSRSVFSQIPAISPNITQHFSPSQSQHILLLSPVATSGTVSSPSPKAKRGPVVSGLSLNSSTPLIGSSKKTPLGMRIRLLHLTDSLNAYRIIGSWRPRKPSYRHTDSACTICWYYLLRSLTEVWRMLVSRS